MDQDRIKSAFESLKVQVSHKVKQNGINTNGTAKHNAASLNGANGHGHDVNGVNGVSDHDPKTVTEKHARADYLSQDDEFHRYLSYQVPGTSCSLLDTEAYRSWHDSPHRASILVEGLAGTGKSVVCAAVIDRLQKTKPEAVILYFFFRQTEGVTRSLTATLAQVWIAKLSQRSVYLSEEFQRLGRRHTNNKLPEEAQWDFLLASLLSVGTSYCIVDALDQVDSREASLLAVRLHAIATLRPRTTKLFMTSRPRKELHCSSLLASSLYVNMDEGNIRDDIHSVVHQRLYKAIPSHDFAEVRAAIAKNVMASLPVFSQGPFLYARSLVDGLTGLKPLDNLTKPPQTVEDVYNVMQLLIRYRPGQGIQSPVEIPKSPLSSRPREEGLDWRDYSARDRPGKPWAADGGVSFIQYQQDQLPLDHGGQTCFQIRDPRGVRRHLVRMFIERRLFRDISQGQRPPLHSLFETICCAISCLDVFFEYADHIDCHARDMAGRTLLHAACNAKVLRAAYLLPGNAHIPRGDIWYWGTGLFLQILQHNSKADPYAIDKEGRDALHTLLSNRDMCEDHILSFLQKYGSQELVRRKDKRGFTALHHALRVLRPRACEALLAHGGADLLEPDPDGNTALHHIARQCLCTETNERSGVGFTSYTTRAEYAAACLKLWRGYLSLGGSPDVLDSRGLPPLFYYVASGCCVGQQQHRGVSVKPNQTKGVVKEEVMMTNNRLAANGGKMDGGHGYDDEDEDEEDCGHFQQFYVYFAGAMWEPAHHARLKKELLNRAAAGDGNEAHYTSLLKHLERWVLKSQ